MNVWENIRIAIGGLTANKLRSLLTMLGIIIGVLAVILGTAIGQGSSQQVLDRIQSLGSNSITIFAGSMRQGPVNAGAGSSQKLSLDDVTAIEENCPTVINVAPQVNSSAQVKYGNQNTATSIVCTTPGFLPIRGFAVETGRFFTNAEVRSRRKVCVVGKTTATTLFDGSTPIGKSLRIRGINFRIVGLLASKGSAMFGDPDDQIVIPVTTGMKQVFGRQYLSSIYAQTARADQAEEASQEIEAALRTTHKLTSAEDDDFMVRTQEEFMQTQEQSSKTLTYLLSGIAAVALLVGGIGIMNIMLVSVTERTREIGIRKAVGARNGDILMQFLIEATTLSVIGGILGIGGGFLACRILTSGLGWPTIISMVWVGVSFFSAAAIGVFFGIYPAYQAAQLDPIEALRYQ
jgi:ABC-type antimicrobial peptide transport system permease subunit